MALKQEIVDFGLQVKELNMQIEMLVDKMGYIIQNRVPYVPEVMTNIMVRDTVIKTMETRFSAGYKEVNAAKNMNELELLFEKNKKDCDILFNRYNEIGREPHITQSKLDEIFGKVLPVNGAELVKLESTINDALRHRLIVNDNIDLFNNNEITFEELKADMANFSGEIQELSFYVAVL